MSRPWYPLHKHTIDYRVLKKQLLKKRLLSVEMMDWYEWQLLMCKSSIISHSMLFNSFFVFLWSSEPTAELKLCLQHEWMTGWVNKWMNEWMNESGWIGEWANKWVNKWVNEWASKWMESVQFCTLPNENTLRGRKQIGLRSWCVN
jgi:hypothetical protein